MEINQNALLIKDGTSAAGTTRLVGYLLKISIPILMGILGGTAQGAASETDGYTRHLFAKGLDRPQAVVPISDHSALVAERAGRVLLIDGGNRIDLGSINVQGMHIFYVAPDTEGLKDLISIPGRSGEFLWCMTTGSEQKVGWTVGRALVETKPREPPTMRNEIIWQSEPQPWTSGSLPPFSGCRMLVDQDEIVVAMGANNRRTGSGRIVRISKSPSNAFHLISTGHRNPGGIVLNDGILWEVEFGPTGGDELNVIVAGSDYGWPDVSKGQPDDGPRTFLKTRLGSVDPVVYWVPSINPASLTKWRGKLYVGTLVGAVVELTVDGKNVVSQKRMLQFGARIRDVRAGIDDKQLWVLTDGPSAELFQVTPEQ